MLVMLVMAVKLQLSLKDSEKVSVGVDRDGIGHGEKVVNLRQKP